MNRFLRRIPPVLIVILVRFLKAYVVVLLGGTIAVTLWIAKRVEVPVVNVKSNILKEPKGTSPLTFPAVPSISEDKRKFLKKRLRIEEPTFMVEKQESASVEPTAAATVVPAFQGELIATFVENEGPSRAVFRISGTPRMLAVGETIDQLGTAFQLVRVDRQEVELEVLGQRAILTMRIQ